MEIHTGTVSHTDVIYEDPPGVPLYHEPVQDVANLERGDHILYQVCQEPYSACYCSALATDVGETRIRVVMNSIDGVKEEWLDFFDFTNFYLVKYSHCYSSDEAVQRAMQRLNWNEKLYHYLYNNSHHFVTLAKTGRENPLTEIIDSLTYHQGMFLSTFVFFFLLFQLYRSGVISFNAGWRLPIGTSNMHSSSTSNFIQIPLV